MAVVKLSPARSDTWTSSTTFRSILSPVSSRTISNASKSGTPARTKEASCLEKCMTSGSLIFRAVISNWRALFCSLTSETRRPRSRSVVVTPCKLSASSVPVTFSPLVSTAEYLYLPMSQPLDRVDRPHDLWDRGDVLGDEADAFVEQRAHARSDCFLIDLVVVGARHDELFDFGCH